MQADSLPTQNTETTATAEVAVPEPSALAVRYHRSGNVLWAGATVLDLLLPGALLFTGLSARVRRVAERLARGRRFATIALYAMAYVLIQALVFLPLGWYVGYVRQHASMIGRRRSPSRRWSPRSSSGFLIGSSGSAPAAGGSGPASSPPRSPCSQ